MDESPLMFVVGVFAGFCLCLAMCSEPSSASPICRYPKDKDIVLKYERHDIGYVTARSDPSIMNWRAEFCKNTGPSDEVSE